MRIKFMALTLGLSLASAVAGAQSIVKLWDTPPTDNGLAGKEEVLESGHITQVYEAELHIYSPAKSHNKGTCVLICPGGGYTRLAFHHEGIQFAQWLNAQGYTGAVLKYRMPNGHKEVPMQDAVQAMHYLRAHAQELGLKPHKIGVSGFSAGGHLAASLSTLYPDSLSRPDFTILYYPVVTMQENTHAGSCRNLLGPKPTPEDCEAYSLQLQVNAHTPPAVLFLSADDRSVPVSNSTLYYRALRGNQIPASLYLFPHGGHGWGFKEDFAYHKSMLCLLEQFLQEMAQE